MHKEVKISLPWAFMPDKVYDGRWWLIWSRENKTIIKRWIALYEACKCHPPSASFIQLSLEGGGGARKMEMEIDMKLTFGFLNY